MDLLAIKKRILGAAYLNFKAGDFKNPVFKDVVQSIIKDFYFTKQGTSFDLNTISSSFNPSSFIEGARKLQTDYRAKYNELFGYTVGGQFGPGELVSYFLTGDGVLTGRSESGDLRSGNQGVEIKAARITTVDGKRTAVDMRTGGTAFSIYMLYNDLAKLAKDNNIPIAREIPKSTMDKLRQVDTSAFENIEKKYQDLVFNNYFNKYGLIIFDNGSNKGTVALAQSKGQLNKDQISINRLTQNAFTCNITL